MGARVPARLASEASARFKTLELLYDYTKFHIGIYITLTASYLSAAALRVDGKALLNLNLALAAFAVPAFMLAGLAGGVIVSSITQSTARSSLEFLETKIGPWAWQPFKAKAWTQIEHNSFWFGLVCAILSFIDKSVWRDVLTFFGDFS